MRKYDEVYEKVKERKGDWNHEKFQRYSKKIQEIFSI